MKVLQISKYYHPHFGGIENHVYTLSEELKKQKNEVIVVASSDNKKFETSRIKGVKIIRYPKHLEIFNAPVSPDLLFHSISNYDVVHIHLPNPFTSLLSLLTKNKNLIVTYHSDIVKFGGLRKFINFLYTKLVLTKILRKAKRIIATSPNYVEGSPILKKFKQKTVVVPFGINLSLFRLNNKKMKKLRMLKKKYSGKRIILFVGRLVPYKGLPYLINAMKKVVKRDPNVCLLIVGNGSEMGELKNLVNSSNLDHFVEFIGEVQDIDLPVYYNLCDIFVLPSTYKAEAFGIAQLEAMACGKPVISINIPGSGVSFVNLHKKTGLVVRPKNAQDLADAISYLLKNKNIRKRFGRNAFKRVKNLFNKDIMTRSILDIYKQVR